MVLARGGGWGDGIEEQAVMKGLSQGLSRGQRSSWSLARMKDDQAGGSELLDSGP